MTKLQSLIEDLKKAEKISKDIQSLSITTVKLKNPLDEIIEYAINTNIISGSKDVLEIYKEVSQEVAELIADKMDKKAKEKREKEAYDSYWQTTNNRCGVSISSRC